MAIDERVDQESTYIIEVEAGDDVEFQMRTDDGEWTAIRVIDLDDQSVVLEFAGSSHATLTLTAESSGRYRIRVTPEAATELTVRIK